jgi:uncharacterized protein YkwD
MKWLILPLLLLVNPLARAEQGGSPLIEKEVLREVFSLRAESDLPKLKRSEILGRVADRSAEANLSRQTKIEHTDSSGKSLGVRAIEEKYTGATGEICAVVYLLCEEAAGSELEYAKTLGTEFKESIRNSASHYNGLMARTGKDWNEYGVSLHQQRETLQGVCMIKTSLTLVLGKSSQSALDCKN